MNNDITPPKPSDSDNSIIPESIRQAAGDISNNLTNAADNVEQLTNKFEEKIDQTLQQAEGKFDSFVTGLDKFLGKF